jgi:thiol-disulfide isomerase/thioredoxin
MGCMPRSRVFLLLPALVLASLLVGCGSSKDDTPRAAAPSTPTPTRASPTTATTPPSPSATPATPIPREYDEKADARADIRTALAASKQDGKPVLLDFGADWCPDCRVLEKLYRSPAVRSDLTSAYHLVLVNVGEFDTNLGLAAHYIDLRKSGIPALAVVRDGRTVYASNRGQFADARTMQAPEVKKFLRTWAG